VLSSCPVKVDRPAWLSSGRFIRALAPIAGFALVAVVLYNATSIDRVPPSFQIKLSAPGPADQAMTLTSVDVVFTEKVNTGTAERAFSITPSVAGSFHWQGLVMIFTPSEKLPLSAAFTVHMAAGVEDLAGNVQGKAQDMTFTTVGAPRVDSVVPPLGQLSVPVDTKIQITFDRLMDTTKVLDGLTIQPDAPFTASWKGPVLTIVPNNPLSFSTTYQIRISGQAVDTDGTHLDPFTTSFSTVNMGLRVTSLIPSPNVAGVSVLTPIAVAYDWSIDPASVADAITLTPPVSGKTAVVSLPDDRSPSAAAEATPAGTAPGPGKNVLVFTPDQPLAPHTTYQVTIGSGVRRTDGQAAAGESWTFTTGEPAVSGQNQIVFLSDRGGVANVWMMNPDGSNQREVTAELVPVTGFDVSGDGSTIAFSAGGVVKRSSIGGANLQTLTPSGFYEYAPTFTPDGTGLIVGRRDATGADLGYWRIPMVTGADQVQVAPDGAPRLGSVALEGDGLLGTPGAPAWASRAALAPDGQMMLVVRGADDAVELVDLTGARPAVVLPLLGNSRPIWDPEHTTYYVVATEDGGATWSNYRVGTDGVATRVSPAVADLAIDNHGEIAYVVRTLDGSTHLAVAASPDGPASGLLTSNPTWSDASPSFSPDGSEIVFARFPARSPMLSGGIWTIGRNGLGLTNLAIDGAYPRWLP
jgi:hypothetical protein